MTKSVLKNVYTIAPGQPFARIIAEKLLEDFKDNEFGLTDATILLPTRRACRNFQNTFLQITQGKPLLLPKIQPFGDIDEQDLSLSLAGNDMLEQIVELPPAISALRRRILLAKTIMAIPQFTSGFDQAIALADELGRFLDQIIIEGLAFENLEHIVPAEFADHWQITLDFLKILGEHWPAILEQENAIEAADRRNRLMRIWADYLEETKPHNPIIAAGSTGSIPATAHLLSVIADLPSGQVILPGLDQDLDQKSWETLDESHPQFGLKHLLGEIGVERGDVQNLQNQDHSNKNRVHLSSELMRPSETTKDWQTSYSATPDKLTRALKNIDFFEADTRREEALAIALKFRETLEHPKKTAALITPDRKLARQVCAICARWDIQVDDSAGVKLNATPIGIFALLICEATLKNLSPNSLLALMKHRFTQAGLNQNDFQLALNDLEHYALRGLKPKEGITGLKERIDGLERVPDMTHVLSFLDHIEPILNSFINIFQYSDDRPFKEFLIAHIQVMEALAQTEHNQGREIIWTDEDGETMAALLSELMEHAEAFDDVDGHSYMRILSHLMSTVSVRPKYGTHPRLSILGQLEARLIDCDLLILSGLNEGSWPADPRHDPWMSRPMRKEFGLPAPERSIGLAAHDFVQGFCHGQTYLTRSKAVDGTQQVPARWLQRLDTVLKTNDMSLQSLHDHNMEAWIETLDFSGEPIPLERPAPSPPLEARPKRLSVTKIETWMKDPYAIYASEVLDLKKLEPIEKPIEAKEKGTLLHGIFEKFISDHPKNPPNNAQDILFEIAKEKIESFGLEDSDWSFWWPRFEKISDWFVRNEQSWRQENRNLSLESKGYTTIETGKASLVLNGIADRIDLQSDGNCAIIDYKTSAGFSASKIANGETPQLALEALMLENNAFAEFGITSKKAKYIGYWCMTGGQKPSQIIALPNKKNNDLSKIIERTQEGLKGFIDAFADPQTPYICLPKSHQIPRFNDYEHLSRVKEWAALDDSEQEAAA